MIHASSAKNISQQVNRNLWLEATSKRLSNRIEQVAQTGKRELEVPFDEIIVGAENLAECAEMLNIYNKILSENGYKHNVSPDGVLTISW